ncbi:MAG: glycosyl transferase family 39, partial [Candidatus Binatus sp.]|nr:glycosyl transferase family 39 [Candidatus Binatus sp.]
MLIIAIALGGYLRFADLGALEMSPDEGASWGAASAPTIAEVIARQARLNPGKMPIHDLMLHFWIASFGSSLPAMRTMSAMLGTLAILMVYFLGLELFADADSIDSPLSRDDIRLIAALGAFVFAVNLVTIKYSRETRMYPLMLAATLAQVIFFLRAIRLGGLPNYLALAILNALAIGSNFSAVLIPAIEALWLLWLFARLKFAIANSAVRRIIGAAIALGVGGLIFTPQLLHSFGATTAGTPGGIIRWIPRPPIYAPFALFNKATGSIAFPMLALLAIWGALVAWRRGARDAVAFALLWMWAPPILMMLASYTLTPIFVERYALSCFAPFFILVGVGLF